MFTQYFIPKACLHSEKVVNCGMFTKWSIEVIGLELYRFDENGELWKLPFKSVSGKYISAKKIKKDNEKKRWIINGNWWSENQLRPHLILDQNPFELTKENELPF